MHWQSISPSRERDHRISLMPMAPEGEPTILQAVSALLLLIAAAAGFVIAFS